MPPAVKFHLMLTSSGVRSSENAVFLAASVGYVWEVLRAEGASMVAAIVFVEACCFAWSKTKAIGGSCRRKQ